LESKFTNGTPEHLPTKYSFVILSPLEKEEEDAKGKKAPAKAAAPVTDEEEKGNEIKIVIDTCNPNEDLKTLSFEMDMIF